MTIAAPKPRIRLERRKARVAARAIAERRRHRRAAPRLTALALYENGQEHACAIENVSAGGLCARAEKTPRVNAPIVLVIDTLGRLEGVVSRVKGDVFSVRFEKVSDGRRLRIADQLIWEANREALDLVDDRQAARRLRGDRVEVAFDDGVIARAKYLDESEIGASFAAYERPRDGERAHVAARSGRIARRHDRGFAVRFDDRRALAESEPFKAESTTAR